mmetsp:Transcript_3696/g.10910  ORF Transcript_3696/g.10910 Transcript_3696/m.10910 type:complete len:108 (-) Transcript_3696:236-559(-)
MMCIMEFENIMSHPRLSTIKNITGTVTSPKHKATTHQPSICELPPQDPFTLRGLLNFRDHKTRPLASKSENNLNHKKDWVHPVSHNIATNLDDRGWSPLGCTTATAT